MLKIRISINKGIGERIMNPNKKCEVEINE